jgi:hypothetical protein
MIGERSRGVFDPASNVTAGSIPRHVEAVKFISKGFGMVKLRSSKQLRLENVFKWQNLIDDWGISKE